MKDYKFEYLEHSRFLMANMFYVLNLDTMKFELLEDINRFVCSIPRYKRPNVTILTPLYLWKYLKISEGQSLYAPDGIGVVYRLVTHIEFPTFMIDLNLAQSRYSPFTPEIVIGEGSKQTVVKLHIQSDGWVPESIDYDTTINGVVKPFSSPVVGSLYKDFCGLARMKLHANAQNWFSFGIPEHKLEIEYRDRYIRRQCYALIYGPIAILLDDNMNFSSLVSLIGVSDKCITVRQFLYTVDTYIVKIITLQR